MMRYIAMALSAVGLAANAESVSWPPLPNKGFVTGRAATKADVAADRAVFVAAQGEVVIGKPLNLIIPQYAWFNDESGRKPAIIIQAEDANGQHLVGARLLTGERVAGFVTDFVLLGKTTPKQKP